jgi:hypothetical protein
VKEIDEFLEFLLEHESDDRIKFSKKMRYGYRHYYISFNIDEKPDEDELYQGSTYRISDCVDIVVDNRNQCIEVVYDNGMKNIIIEDINMINKWNDILESYINKDFSDKTKSFIEDTLNSCYNKNLYREYQIKKILPNNNESL